MSEPNSSYLIAGDDGIPRCRWGHGPDIYRKYHDEEWGRPVADDTRLFEKICLEGFQSGLSWLTILRKRENFRAAFAGFDFNRIAEFGDADVTALVQNEGIIRHRGKIEATINNARRAQELVHEFGSLARYIWQWEPDSREPQIGEQTDTPIPSITKTSQALSKDLKKRGWKFFGPTTAYAFMQAMGLVNDHVEGCAIRETVERERRAFERPR
ncbi:DNA-3-methyladenine glycosylase I [Pontiella agarivorans]|uniref:DNA-3-methyladenine glycosylase I n=1 Tax=Pontiella agarivorans TaxID=3038953 RepID=A0ABU5MZ99_9BACT|nr:DNA-3-methyladenine glycosylase I [Pontiella agarivorans]MDZ8119510.1 DNA-3-methyladenine glycosylase I [Pontiella agarivorans]